MHTVVLGAGLLVVAVPIPVTVKRANQWERAVVLRLGKLQQIAGLGIRTDPEIHVTARPSSPYMSPGMRFLLAILAVVGLLMSPVAASAGAVVCLHHGGEAMAMDAPQAPTGHAADHSCCDDDGAPVKHDSQSCAKACAAMCVASVTLADDGFQIPRPEGRLRVEALPVKALHTHAPPGLKRPPRTVA